MGRPPAVVIVARYYLCRKHENLRDSQCSHIDRHGARLDAADTQWHLTSPTPYDPPLTYGGWRQSQALGGRIASIIQSREAATSRHSSHSHSDLDINGGSLGKERRDRHHSPRGRRRRHKIVVHSSPFLRCVQTSIAISAGIAQYQDPSKPSSHQSHSKPHVMHSGSPHLHAMEDRKSHRLSVISEPGAAGTSGRRIMSQALDKIPRTLLRVDAFLGEWLSPEYFDKITPPPGSKLMVASAKAELLRQGDPVDMVHTSKRNVSGVGNFLWTGTTSASKSQSFDEDTPLNDMSSLSKNMPTFSRANSHSLGSSPTRSSMKITSRVETSPAIENPVYVPPTPSYAISPSQPIPQGYVTHARNACVKVDYQWDSFRPPLEWGNGGEYGEEWSNMHKRFRRGLHEMISWYRSHEPSEALKPVSDGSPQSQSSQSTQGTQSSEASEDDDVDTVLVLVTHGAGCNALIGALTNQPVLIDVGMASLTMAVRKTVEYKRVASPISEVPPTSPSRRRQSLADFGISDEFEVKLVSSTEHLRAGSPFLAGPKVKPNVSIRDKSPYRYERPGFVKTSGSTSSAMDDGLNSDSDSSNSTSTSSRFGGLQRSATTAVKSSGGLWSKPEPKNVIDVFEKDTKRPSSQAVQNDSLKTDSLDGTSEKTHGTSLEQVKSDPTNGDHTGRNLANGFHDHGQQGRSIAPNGLWGTPPQALGTQRETGTKRRWTLSQAS